jgi:hypothetical protein
LKDGSGRIAANLGRHRRYPRTVPPGHRRTLGFPPTERPFLSGEPTRGTPARPNRTTAADEGVGRASAGGCGAYTNSGVVAAGGPARRAALMSATSHNPGTGGPAAYPHRGASPRPGAVHSRA